MRQNGLMAECWCARRNSDSADWYLYQDLSVVQLNELICELRMPLTYRGEAERCHAFWIELQDMECDVR